MYHRVRKKMTTIIIISAILLLVQPLGTSPRTLDTSTTLEEERRTLPDDEGFDNNIIDFDEEYTVKFNKKYGAVPWHANDFNKNSHKYTIINDEINKNDTNVNYDPNNIRDNSNLKEETTTEDYQVIPLELVSTTEDALVSIVESTSELDLTVIPLSTTNTLLSIKTEAAVTLSSTTAYETSTKISDTTTDTYEEHTTTWEPTHLPFSDNTSNIITVTEVTNINVPKVQMKNVVKGKVNTESNTIKVFNNSDSKAENKTTTAESKEDSDVPIFTELDAEDFGDIPEDYYDSKDVVPTSAPKTDAFSVLFGLAGSVVESVVESVAEKVVPKTIFDLFKRMQRQSEALEAEKLRSREENGGLGQLGRGILKSLSSGLGKPLSQLMAGVKEAGSLDTDRGFVGSVASSVTSVANAANSYLEAFKDKVQAIYPGTVWCGDGHSAQARSSSELGLFFFTDTCCRQHDACKIYIKAGETKYGLTNTGLFTRSHCSCDTKFRDCLRRTNSLVSAQIGLTYFNVLGPQCFRRAHPIIKCNRRTRITGLKCEEYDLDYTKPKMWQWFDNETF